MAEDAEVKVQRYVENRTVLVVLNRVRKLNALNLNMVKIYVLQLFHVHLLLLLLLVNNENKNHFLGSSADGSLQQMRRTQWRQFAGHDGCGNPGFLCWW